MLCSPEAFNTAPSKPTFQFLPLEGLQVLHPLVPLLTPLKVITSD